LRQIIGYLEDQLELRFEYPSEGLPPDVLERLITLEVREVPVDELLRAAFEPVGVAFARDGMHVELKPVQ
jgi:hypothetical protein